MVEQATAAQQSRAELGAYELAREDFAHRWAAAIGSTVLSAMSREEVVRLLAGFTDELHAAVAGEHPGVAQAQALGRAMIENDFISTVTLERTLAFVGEHLLPHFGLPADRTHRLMAVLGGIAAGYSDALRDRTLEQQELSKSAAIMSIREAEAALRASEAKFRAVFRTSAVAIAVTSPDGTLLDFNEALLSLLGYTADEIRGMTSRDLVHPDDRGAIDEIAGTLATGERDHVRVEKRLVRSDGETMPALVAMSLVRDELGEPAYHVAMIEDLDEVRALQTQLLKQSLNDAQTGLANRAQFLGWLEGASGSQGPDSAALLVFNVDGFRVLNDAFGYEVGNRLLASVAGHLRAVFDGVGELARIGPDEFGVLIRDPADLRSVIALVEEVVELLAEPVWVDGAHGVGVSVSVGIAVRRGRGWDAAELLRCADVAVGWAKADGKAQWVLHDPERDQRDRARFALAASIPGGLEQGDFRVDYAPVHSLADRSLVAVEAKLRWDHPEHGLLDPHSLTSVCASNGMAVLLGRWALEQACAQAGRWHAALGDAAPALQIDLSTRQCQEPELVGSVLEVLRASGLPAAKLLLELNEHLILTINDEQVENLAILREHGVRLLLDRQGSGALPPERLRELGLNGVKYQSWPVRSLAADANRHDDSAAVALFTWARTLGMPLYAADVDDEHKAARLAEFGVRAAQGPLFGPELLTAAEVDALLALPSS
ncbi:PAS domain S-box-containing protein/diguanylate cyclase (GGDEF)-like protein [Saccharothrix coeruleofusca]|uniref:putative bifunctional diguanylate cyclase/phosphodiesterase n=1 Tax=Saccharothrix coeruleofusca TaxID=33919 RepID=UPI001AE50426|nr:EAL domain-containing protein [Saccharothrix coeruleofusca]MBP2338952.1 PAS domain S-box-containing protein/diguanylate cyclase (GGDEF)-like protein [Saccharothrix coeruleofusca]